jgi:hypothetical protein
MNWLNKILEVIIGSEELSELKSSKFRDFLNGNILKKRFIQKQYGLFVFVAVLIFISIDNRYACEAQIAQEVKLKKELQDIKFESLTISSQLTTLGRRSYVLDYIAEKGMNLKESPIAPIVITAPGEENEKALTDSLNKLNAKKDTTASIAVD